MTTPAGLTTSGGTFSWLTDIDGEDAFIRIGSIAMVRVPLDAMAPVEEDDE